MAMGTGHTGARGTSGVGSTDVMQGCHWEGAGMPGVGMLQGMRKWVVFKGNLCNKVKRQVHIVICVTLTCLWSCGCIMGYD